jgi:hypothetical protein
MTRWVLDLTITPDRNTSSIQRVCRCRRCRETKCCWYLSRPGVQIWLKLQRALDPPGLAIVITSKWLVDLD